MGMTVEISTLEEMCAMMCDNVIPNNTVPAKDIKETESEKYWYFTFGCGQPHDGHYVKIRGTYVTARRKMCERYGTKWGFQYSEEIWKEMVNDPFRTWPIETELETIE